MVEYGKIMELSSGLFIRQFKIAIKLWFYSAMHPIYIPLNRLVVHANINHPFSNPQNCVGY